ncbi:MAG TPA: Rrf2 family transcriptional regulator [Anaeromyxobacteraceae bacterium]|nr:Rrf2 family transcriptional regulator [Anaeromyxobacteraceae bacterium]
MPGIVKLSEAASIALHAMTLVAEERERHVSARDLAARLPVSEAHLAKVMQRLARAGLVTSVRGPGGGFALRADPRATTLLQIYEAIEGTLEIASCMFPERPDDCQRCIIDDAIAEANRVVHARLARTHLSDLTRNRGRAGPPLVPLGRPPRPEPPRRP